MRRGAPAHKVARIRSCFVALLCVIAFPSETQEPIYQQIKQLEARATLAVEQYETALAIQYFTQLISLDPSSFFAHAKLAENYFIIRAIDLARVHALRARHLNQSDVEIQILLARIHIAENDNPRAAQILTGLERADPRNTRLQLARAELAVSEYNYLEAVRIYQSVLSKDGNDIVALLGLALLREEQGDLDAAERLIARARDRAPQRLAAYFLSARHYQRRAQYDRAQRYVDVALRIAPGDEPTQVLASEIARARGALDEAQRAIEELISVDNRRAQYWYMHGSILTEQAQNEAAIESYQRALLLQRDHELSRFALEELMRQHLSDDDERRSPVAAYRFDRARALRDRNLLHEATDEVRRGLQMAPRAIEGRLLFAELERLNGLDAKYVRELELAQSFGDRSQSLSDRIETINDLISRRPAAEWGVDQFTVNRDGVRIGVLMNRAQSRVTVDSTLQTVGDYLVNVLRFSERVEAASQAVVTNGPTPFQINEDIRDYDYVLHCYLKEARNSVQLTAQLFSPLSRAVIVEYTATFVGAQRYARAVRHIVDRVEAGIPLRGQVLARQQNRVLINVGRAHGVDVNEEFVTVERGQLTVSDAALAFRYPDASEVGRVTITEADDLVAEATVMRSGLFDNFTVGDEVFAPSRALPQRTAVNTPSPLYDYILQIR